MVISYLNHTLTFNIAAPESAASSSQELIDEALDGIVTQSADVKLTQIVSARELWRCLMKRYVYVKAAGGIVVDPDTGLMLLIRRHGMWDLPKGHVEAGETLAAAALREVAEETSLAPLALGRLVDKVYHIYPTPSYYSGKECLYLKQTTWFEMSCRGASADRRGAPQTDEGIVQLVWTTPEEWKARLQSSYASLRLLSGNYL